MVIVNYRMFIFAIEQLKAHSNIRYFIRPSQTGDPAQVAFIRFQRISLTKFITRDVEFDQCSFLPVLVFSFPCRLASSDVALHRSSLFSVGGDHLV